LPCSSLHSHRSPPPFRSVPSSPHSEWRPSRACCSACGPRGGPPASTPSRHCATSDMSGEVDLLAVMAHPDDAELLCGGTLARATDAGYRVGGLDRTRGENGTWGSAEGRAREAEAAAGLLGVSVRANAGLADGGLVNTPETRNVVAAQL